jgi:hypothetical protein
MRWLQILRPLALTASLPLIALAALAAWRSLERLYIAYLFNHGRLFADDLSEGHINIDVEVKAWCLVLGVAFLTFMLLRFWRRSNAGQ